MARVYLVNPDHGIAENLIPKMYDGPNVGTRPDPFRGLSLMDDVYS